MKRFRVTDRAGETLDVRAVDWMMAMAEACRIRGVEVASWVCHGLPDGAMYVADPATGRAWTVEVVDDATPPGALRRVPAPAAGLPHLEAGLRPARDDGGGTSGASVPPAEEAPPDLAERLFERSTDLSFAADADAAARIAVAIVHDFVPCEAVSVLLGGLDAPSLVFAAASGPAADALVGRTVPFGKGLVGTAHDAGVPLRVTDATADRRHLRWFDEQTGFETRNVLCVPIRYEGRYHGVIQCLNAPGDFLPWHVEAVDTVARALAATLDGRVG